jgi:predicted DNA-binding transcriptional regulator YafY
MPKNYNSVERYHYYDRLFTIGNFTKAEILQKLKNERSILIGRRTFDADIKFMRSNYNAPISYDRQIRTYKYDFQFSIRAIPLNETEKEELALATSILVRYSGYNKLDKLAEAVTDVTIKLMAHLGSDNKIVEFIEFDRARGDGGTRHLLEIFTAIKNKRPLRILHKRNDKPQPKQYDIHPYRLKEYLKTWYVLALDEGAKTLKVFGLDRIATIEPLNNLKLTPPPQDISKYFEHIVGVKKPAGQEPKEIKIKCLNYKGAYFQSQPLHKSQQLIESTPDGETMIFKFDIILNEEFYGELGRWGEDAVVIYNEPQIDLL